MVESAPEDSRGGSDAERQSTERASANEKVARWVDALVEALAFEPRTQLAESRHHHVPNIPAWTPRVIAENASIGGLGPVSVGSPATVADEVKRRVGEADVDGFIIRYVTTSESFEDVIDLLVPEMRRREIYAEIADEEKDEEWTAREKVYGNGQKGLRDDRTGAGYKYDVYEETLR